jgi:hypothetical protein
MRKKKIIQFVKHARARELYHEKHFLILRLIDLAQRKFYTDLSLKHVMRKFRCLFNFLHFDPTS